MNVFQKGAHSMRIVALPLARVKKPQGSGRVNVSVNTMLVFYHFDLISPGGGNKDHSWHQKALNGAVNKASELWTSLGKAPRGSWKLWAYAFGERVADQVEFEELALASIDTSSGPTVPLNGTKKQVNESQLLKIPLIYPPSLYPVLAGHALHPALAHMQALLTSRRSQHQRGFYLWLLITPLTVPISIIPIIPNFPLFFCVWRSWLHYRAYRSSQYLSSLLDHRLIEPNPSLELDKIYGVLIPPSKNFPQPSFSSKASENSSTVGDTPNERGLETAFGTGEPLPEGLLLNRKVVPLILGLFRLPESVTANIHRAMEQAHRRVGKSL